VQELRRLPEFSGRATRRAAGTWHGAIADALTDPEGSIPERKPEQDGPPPSNRWADKEPQAASRLTVCRTAVSALAERHELPAENLLPPAALRQLAWEPPDPATSDTVAAVLRAEGARQWQVDLTADDLAAALTSP
ncbi:MAG: ribonuclease D, partial [Streptosporangiales bacterium]